MKAGSRSPSSLSKGIQAAAVEINTGPFEVTVSGSGVLKVDLGCLKLYKGNFKKLMIQIHFATLLFTSGLSGHWYPHYFVLNGTELWKY